MPLPQENKKYTYADYFTWPDEERWEIIDGIPYMQAAPSWQHQSISLELSRQFANYLINKSCRVFTAPFDLIIPEENKKDEDCANVVQPDLIIVCNKEGLKGTGYYGVPSLIIEISSPSTTRRDKVFKFNKYEKAGVKEYWIVEPEGKFISVFVLQDNMRYGRPETYTEENKIKVSIFSDLEIDLNTVFDSI
ncbi:Uma2 family endonuclease [Clostridium sp. P21]|uniref:Uma2 family endonuclease n=1 Tax=Clostridium muellerianum TaxID=2716538 RepID=A0A7Y0EH06_9CLOT|nr:Uma2 family endonuclease [Clostridium muellerianum]NMM63311.1 Uma2 family endonuclease [Clostridium muellerianum]